MPDRTARTPSVRSWIYGWRSAGKIRWLRRVNVADRPRSAQRGKKRDARFERSVIARLVNLERVHLNWRRGGRLRVNHQICPLCCGL